METTTIQITKNQADELGNLKENDGQSYRDVIARLLRIGEPTEVPCGCGEYAAMVPSQPLSLDVVCPECENHFGFGTEKGEDCPCQHDHDADITTDDFDIDLNLDGSVPTYDDIKAACQAALREELPEGGR